MGLVNQDCVPVSANSTSLGAGSEMLVPAVIANICGRERLCVIDTTVHMIHMLAARSGTRLIIDINTC